jgi:hypothetical protein
MNYAELLALSDKQQKRIESLESIAYAVQSADLCYGSYSTYEIDGDTVERAKELLNELIINPMETNL